MSLNDRTAGVGDHAEGSDRVRVVVGDLIRRLRVRASPTQAGGDSADDRSPHHIRVLHQY